MAYYRHGHCIHTGAHRAIRMSVRYYTNQAHTHTCDVCDHVTQFCKNMTNIQEIVSKALENDSDDNLYVRIYFILYVCMLLYNKNCLRSPIPNSTPKFQSLTCINFLTHSHQVPTGYKTDLSSCILLKSRKRVNGTWRAFR